MRRLRVTADLFDGAAEIGALTDGRTDIGAVATFTGYCRDEGGTLAALELEHFPGMADAEIARLAEEAERRWPLLGLCIVHRYGVIRPGEPIVFVAACAAHREPAFAAAAYAMDFLKTDAPFWKRQLWIDPPGDPRRSEAWVAAKGADDDARARWSR